METRKAQRQRRSVAEMIFQRSVQGARRVAFRKLKLFAETQAEARRQKDASMRIAYSLAVQSSDKNRSRNAMNTWLRFRPRAPAQQARCSRPRSAWLQDVPRGQEAARQQLRQAPTARSTGRGLPPFRARTGSIRLVFAS